MEFSEDEELLIARMFNLVGERLGIFFLLKANPSGDLLVMMWLYVYEQVGFDCWENSGKNGRRD